MRLPLQCGALLVAACATGPARGQEQEPRGTADPALIGHSSHGMAYDEGPRTRPWKMRGIGATHLPITTSVPEVQEWFDQGHTLLHSYWGYEAERVFRWCLKLDPECAMAYWGLARSLSREDPEARRDVLMEAVRRKDRVSKRERMYIEAYEESVANFFAVGYTPEQIEQHASLRRGLEAIMLEFPDDIEAKALFVNQHLWAYSKRELMNRSGNELLLQEILEVDPDHPGAHHYRIHNWDGPEGWKALDSCQAYGRIAPDVGHARHMPGHVYSSQGMWHEAAIAMDSATRVEKRYFARRLVFPFNAGNYPHNLDYLCYFLEQLGMPDLALDGGRQLLEAPLDPRYNDPDSGGYGCFSEGMIATVRAMVRFERWDDILTEGFVPWRDRFTDRLWRAYAEALAHLGQEDLVAAGRSLSALEKLEAEAKKPENSYPAAYDIQRGEVEGLLQIARGETLAGLEKLSVAAGRELELRTHANDPPFYPRVLYNVLGEVYLDLGSPKLAIAAFEETLGTVHNDPIALAGLCRAHAAVGQREQAGQYYGRLQFVWSDAEPRLRWLQEVEQLGLSAEPVDRSPGAQRSYRSVMLDKLGPSRWEPYAAPELAAVDAAGKAVTLDEYRGRNVLLVFYLGEECPHCMEQLVAISERQDELSRADVEVLAISSSTPEQNAQSDPLGELGFRLLSDGPDHVNARRFCSYDDFEGMELHSTIWIDRQGKVRWARTGGEPFMDLDFLLAEIERTGALARQ